MMKLLCIVKYKIRCTWNNLRRKRALARAKQEISAYYAAHPSSNKEVMEAVAYLTQHSLDTFLAPFVEKYSQWQIEVHREPSNGLLYVMHEQKKLFFKRSYNVNTVRRCYRALITEQDAQSPHCYIDSSFQVEAGEVLFDIGSAEGIFPLSNIVKASQVVLFERDREWAEALEATFEPWKAKVTIVPKYVSDKNDAENISIDAFLTGYPHRPDFVKIDVEGAEQQVLNGMAKQMKVVPLKLALCTYHQADDYRLFSTQLSEQGFNLSPSRGVMIFLNEMPHLKPPYFRKGIIRAARREKAQPMFPVIENN